MNILNKTAIALSVLGIATASALAQTPPPQKQPGGTVTSPQAQPVPSAPSAPGGSGAPGMKVTFEELDKDRDGSISNAEAMAAPALSKSFASLDKNRDGKLDRAEFSGANLTK